MDSHYIDRLRAVLRDETNAWHVQSSREFTRRYNLFSADKQDAAEAALERGKQAFRDIHTLFQQVK